MSEWISVDDRLPGDKDDSFWVLVYADGAMNCMAYSNGWKDWTNAKTHNICIDQITHWMPLPGDPE